MPQTKGANVNYSPRVYTKGRISCWRLTQQSKQLPIILRRRINGKEYVTSAENDTTEVSNETEVGIYTVWTCNKFLVTTEILLKGLRKITY
jgi:hypothetical protein